MQRSAPRMVFHFPSPLDPDAPVASKIRPVRMREAFEEIGFEVFEISGNHPERRSQIQQLKQQIKRGLKVDFAYSEARTQPTGLGEPVSLATSVNRDIDFLKFCQKNGVPSGVFYRDVYWNFPGYDELIPRPQSSILKYFFRRDLKKYRDSDLTVFLPSNEMAEWVPIINREQVRELPPGCKIIDNRTKSIPGKVRLLYVGGLGSHYGLHKSISEIARYPDVELTLCTREQEWREREPEYRNLLANNIHVVHAHGEELRKLYGEVDASLMVLEPIQYRNFAAPVKLFESIGYGIPVIATTGTFAGRFVEQNKVGWQVEYGSGDFGKLLDKLVSDASIISDYTNHVREVRHKHTWEERAQQVARVLSARELR